ncbi:MAG: fasciclin domain-containing protein [Bacteroidota bacterium]
MQIRKLSLFSWALLGLMFLGFSACDDDDNNTNPEPQTITETAAADGQFSTLVSLLQRVDLDITLNNSDGSFTVFAPNNQAFIDANIDPSQLSDAQLEEILNYHVINGASIASGDLIEGQTYAPSNALTGPGDNALSLLVERAGVNVTVNGAADVITADVRASNGIIHVIDDVLMPLDIVGHAVANSNLSSLVTNLTNPDVPGNLPAALSGTGPLTVFAPVNTAFANIQSTVDNLMPDQINRVLTYHVVAGANVRAEDVMDGQTVGTFNSGQDFVTNKNGDDVSITDDSGANVNVIIPNIQATNGVVHAIDAVLIPSNLTN